MSARGVTSYACVAAFWAAFFCVFTAAVEAFGVAVATGCFCVIGGLALLVMAKLVGRQLNWHLDWSVVLLWSATALVVIGATASAMASLGVALTAILVSSMRLFATVTDQMCGQERVTGVGAVSLPLGIVGLLLVAAFPSGDASWGFIGGVLAALIAAITAGASGRRLHAGLQKARSLETVVSAALLAGVAAFAFAPFTGGRVGSPLVFVGLALLAGGCAFLGLFALSSASSSLSQRTVATLPGVGTVMAVIAGIVLVKETLSAPQWLGMILLLAGTAWLRGLVPRWFPATWRA